MFKFALAPLMALSIVTLSCPLLAASAQAAAQDAKKELTFGIISTESSQHLRKNWEPFLKDMEERTGLTVKPFFVPDYAGVIEGMRFGKVDLAWMGNKAAMEAVDRAGAEIFAQSVAPDGSRGYYSHIIAHVDSPLTSEKDMLAKAADLRFGNGDPNSTSGFLVPSYYVFALNGVDAKKAFKNVVSANHESNALAVANKQVDAATCNNECLIRLENTQPAKRKLIKVIWTSPLIPGDPLVRRVDLPADVKEKVAAFMFAYGKEGTDAQRERDVLARFVWSAIVPSDNSQLIPIRQLELFRDKTRVEGNADLSAADRQKRLDEINAALAELEKAAAKAR